MIRVEEVTLGKHMRRELVNVPLSAALGAALFSLISVIHFWTIQDITAPRDIARIRYDLKCWLVAFVAFTIITIIIAYFRKVAGK